MSLQRVRRDWSTITYTFHSNTNPQIYLAPSHILNFFLCKYIPLFPFCFKFLLSCISLIFSNFFSFLFSHSFLSFLILSALPLPIFCHLPTSHQLAFVTVSNIFLLPAISGEDCLYFLFLGLNIKFRLIDCFTYKFKSSNVSWALGLQRDWELYILTKHLLVILMWVLFKITLLKSCFRSSFTTFYSTSHVTNLKTFSSYTPKSTIHRCLYIFLYREQENWTEFLQFPSLDNHLECLLLFFFSWIHPYTTPLFIRGKRTFYPRLTLCPVHRHHLQFHLQFPSLSLPPSVPLLYSPFLPPSLSLLL